MFQETYYLKYEKDKHYYQLIDSDFSCELSTPYEHGVLGEVAVVAMEYKKRNLYVTENLALLYMFYSKQDHDVDRWLLLDTAWIDKHYPELEYGKKCHNPTRKIYLKLLMLA